MPSFALTLEDVINRIKGKCAVSKASSLILEGAVELENVSVDGSFWIRKCGKDIKLKNSKMITFVDSTSTDEEYLKIRGYKPKKIEFYII